jgi:hypothetical protein
MEGEREREIVEKKKAMSECEKCSGKEVERGRLDSSRENQTRIRARSATRNKKERTT